MEIYIYLAVLVEVFAWPSLGLKKSKQENKTKSKPNDREDGEKTV